ncbi:winged helix-turn-helix domain-containing protein [Neiella marina]|uniref:Winged helix-turn-helix domain-containing protein n=1 Tax=Neiella holothuriorum TaxID=2870530 RepID=A0ABS7ECZ2_9GAMM|nr:winged helix-turn-helix domain-containing protein [Neiella holothuriorum]MBW8190183.1 winged helix-turn-helix domain-containing protein [Neiella holothuriorum]
MIYRFGAYEVNTDEYRLTCKGRLIAVEPKVFDVVAYLIANPNRVVPRAEFFTELWAGVTVSDATLSNHIKLARAALGDNGHDQRVIKTVHGRGYQFVAVVEKGEKENVLATEAPNAASPPFVVEQAKLDSSNAQSTKWMPMVWVALIVVTLIVIAAVAFVLGPFHKATTLPLMDSTSLVGQRSIAILPFKNLTRSTTDDYFTDGIHGDLLTQISKIHGLKTISQSSVMHYRASQQSLTEIANELAVEHLLEGSVQRAGDHIRIAVQLIEANTNEQLWAETYTRTLSAENIFTIQHDIALSIVTQLNLILAPSDAALDTPFPTTNLQALEAYFRAKAMFDRGTRQGFIEGSRLLERAIALDPNFASAYAELALARLGLIYWAGLPTAAQIESASDSVKRALDLTPHSSDAHTARAVLNSNKALFSEAEQAFQHAISLNPNNAKALHEYGLFLLWRRNAPFKATDVLTEARRTAPRDDNIALALVSALTNSGRFDSALQLVDLVLARSPNLAPAYRAKSDIYYWMGHHLAQSQSLLSESLRLDPNMPFNAMVMSTAYVMVGETEIASRWLRHAVKLAPDANNAEFSNVIIELFNGNRNGAFDAYMASDIDEFVFPVVIYDVVAEGIALNRLDVLEQYYRRHFAPLFIDNAEIDVTNYIPAIAVARIFIAKGRYQAAERLLHQSLAVVQVPPYGGWNYRENDWKTKIYLALGETDLAVLSFKEYVAAGFGALSIIDDPLYQPLRKYPEFLTAIDVMKRYLENEREKMRQMALDGSLMLPPEDN